MVKLHLGCSDKILDGYVNIDVDKKFKPDVVHDLSRPLPFDDNSVDEILAEDLLEHFDKFKRYFVMYDWARVLRVGGTIKVQVPNFKKILWRYFKFDFNRYLDMIFGEPLMRGTVYIDHYGLHKWGYTEHSLVEFMKIFGIEKRSVQLKNLNMIYIGCKTAVLDKQSLLDLQVPVISMPDVPLRQLNRYFESEGAST